MRSNKLSIHKVIAQPCLWGATALMMLTPEISMAQQNSLALEEIIVTAQRREQSLQDVPVSITALGENQLQAQGIDGFQDFAAKVPGFRLRGSSSVESTITLRGISPQGGSGSPVAIYLDEMPVSGIQGNGQPSLKTFDVERIEILRGPQGTLYGEGSLGGTIKVLMNKPDASKFAAKITGTIADVSDGDLNSGANVMLNLPLVEDELAVRAIFQYRDNNGFIDAPNLSKEDVNTEELTGGRLSLRWQATDNLTVDLSAITQEVELGGRTTAFSETTTITDPISGMPRTYGERETSIYFPETGEDEYQQYNMTLTLNTENYQFTSATSYFDRDTQIARDLAGLIPVVQGIAGAGAGFGGFNPFLGADSEVTNTGNLRTSVSEILTQEFRVSYLSGERLFWQAGVFYKDREDLVSDLGVSNPTLNWLPAVDLTPIGIPLSYAQDSNALLSQENQNFEQAAIFGEMTYEFTDKLSGTFGLRYFTEDRESTANVGGAFIQASVFGGVLGATGNPAAAIAAADALGIPITTSDSADVSETTWKANLSYQINSDQLVYGTISKGFRAGGVNTFAFAVEGLTGLPIGFLPRSYKPDTLINYEIGAKTAWFNERLIVNGAVFFMDWEDVQVNWDPSGLGLPTTVNGDKAHSQGIELEAKAFLTDAFTLDIAATYTEAELDEDIFSPLNTLIFRNGGRLSIIPEYTFSITGAYSFAISDGLEGIFRANYNYTDDSFRDPGEIEAEENEGYGLASVSLEAISTKGWQLKLFVNNLTDEAAELYLASRGEYNTVLPRTIGINGSYSF